MFGAASRDRSGAYNGGVHLEPPVSFLQDLLPASRVAPAVSEPEAGPDWFDQLTGGLGNAGFGELVVESVDLRSFQLPVVAANEQELQAHDDVLRQLDKSSGGKSLWQTGAI